MINHESLDVIGAQHIAVRSNISKIISSGGKIMYTTWASEPISNSLTK